MTTPTDQQINDLITRHEVHEYHPGAILEFARELLAMAAPALTVGDEPVWPIAKLTVHDDGTVSASLYAPGLPDGEFDVFLEPVPSQPAAQAEPEDERGLALWQLIYGAIAHEPLPLKVAQIEAAARRVEDMLRRRAALAPAAQAEPVAKPCLFGGACKHGGWCSDVYCQERCQFKKTDSLRAIADLMKQADGGWNLPPSATRRIAELLDAMLAGTASQPPAQGQAPKAEGGGQEAELREALVISGENYRHMQEKADRATATIYQFHYAMKDAGWHPGRTDDNLCDIIREKGKELARLRAQILHLVDDLTEEVAGEEEATYYRLRDGKDVLFSNMVGACARLLAAAPAAATEREK